MSYSMPVSKHYKVTFDMTDFCHNILSKDKLRFIRGIQEDLGLSTIEELMNRCRVPHVRGISKSEYSDSLTAIGYILLSEDFWKELSEEFGYSPVVCSSFKDDKIELRYSTCDNEECKRLFEMLLYNSGIVKSYTVRYLTNK